MPLKSCERCLFTYQTRIHCDDHVSLILSLIASLMNKVEHSLFADLAKGASVSELKAAYLKQHKITARHFNSIRAQLDGKISSIREHQKLQITELEQRIASLKTKIKKLKKERAILHQKKRRLITLEARLKKLKALVSERKISLCFGSRKLFHRQFYLKENNYSSHEEWKKEWMSARNASFFLIGSKDETSGNQSCVATVEDGSITLRIRLPDALSEYGKYLVLKGIKFAYGHEAIVAALMTHLEGKEEERIAISYRFLQDKSGWRIFVSTSIKEPQKVTRRGLGVIGVDINSDHLAVVETDRYGNPIERKCYPLCTYGKTKHQSTALIGDVAKSIVEWCVRTKKPLAIENLSFSAKKSTLREIGNKKYARMLSSFAYGAIILMMKAKCFRSGVHVEEVNPAYTSIIGRVKFAKQYGLSIHESAALCIARRCLGVSERLPRHQAIVPDGRGTYVTLALPARNRARHVWSLWKIVQSTLRKRCSQHVPRRVNAILKPEKIACCDKKFLCSVGVIPTR